MAKQTLYITFDGLSDPLGQSQILPYLVGLSQKGYHITILSCEKKDRLDKELPNIKKLIGSTSIHWEYVIYNQVGNFLTRLSYIRQLNRLAKKYHSEKKFKLIHCRSYLSALIGLNLKNKFRIPFLFDMRGFWADERLDGKIWNKNKLLDRAFYTFFKSKEKQFLEKADAIISLTSSAVPVLQKNFPGINIEKKTTVIPCCVNTALFNPSPNLAPFPLDDLKKSDHLLIYTGSIGTWYYTKEMIDCVLEWAAIIPEIKLLIVTKDISEIERILTGYTTEQKQRIIYTSANYSQMPAVLSHAKASIFFIKPAFSKIASSPTKMAECWAMNIPIITNSGIGDNDFYFNQLKGGVLVTDFTNEHYRMAARKYLSLLNSAANYRSIALKHFDTQQAIESYSEIYNALTSE
ncbi:MAG: glycosyltransferase [Bacteroidetes bacterium]|nr:glycosyltransferase [Bacteroidota bacterium]